MTAVDARARLQRLAAERIDAAEAGLAAVAQLADEIAASRAAYIGLAVTEIAVLRAELSGRQVG